MNSKSRLTVIGFLLFLIGIISLVLSLVGLKLAALSWLYELGTGPALLINLLFIMGGLILVYVARSSGNDI